MRTFSPSPKEIEDIGGIIGYPQAGRYVVMVKNNKILGGEIERAGERRQQTVALHRYYPDDAETVIVVLDQNGVFSETDM